MKIYVMTSGTYSDYHIEKIFMNKNKAEEYFKLNKNTGWNSVKLEEWDTADETFTIGEYQLKQYLYISYTDKDGSNKENIYIALKEDNTGKYPNLHDYPYNYSSYDYYDYDSNYIHKHHEITLHRLVADDFTQDDITEDIKNKYLKICRDYLAKAKSLLSEGYTGEQVEEMLFKD